MGCLAGYVLFFAWFFYIFLPPLAYVDAVEALAHGATTYDSKNMSDLDEDRRALYKSQKSWPDYAISVESAVKLAHNRYGIGKLLPAVRAIDAFPGGGMGPVREALDGCFGDEDVITLGDGRPLERAALLDMVAVKILEAKPEEVGPGDLGTFYKMLPDDWSGDSDTTLQGKLKDRFLGRVQSDLNGDDTPPVPLGKDEYFGALAEAVVDTGEVFEIAPETVKGAFEIWCREKAYIRKYIRASEARLWDLKFQDVDGELADSVGRKPKGKVLVVEYEASKPEVKYIDYGFMSLMPEEYQPDSLREVEYILYLKREKSVAGHYIPSGTAYRRTCTATITDLDGKQVGGSNTLKGKGSIPMYISGPSWTSDEVDAEAVLEQIEALLEMYLPQVQDS
ncbi:MAG: hypothetical protein LBR77_02340 [Lachnospiraceae bacterium]|nr:hypothetical protein [Lachnospiraceae bacterium]